MMDKKPDGKLKIYTEKAIDIPNCRCGERAVGHVRLDKYTVRPYCYECHRREWPGGEIG